MDSGRSKAHGLPRSCLGCGELRTSDRRGELGSILGVSTVGLSNWRRPVSPARTGGPGGASRAWAWLWEVIEDRVCMRGPVALSCLSWILRERKAGLYLTLVEFRRDGSFVTQVAHEPAVLAEAWRRAVLLLFVCQGWLEEDAAASMLARPHSGFRAHSEPARRPGRGARARCERWKGTVRGAARTASALRRGCGRGEGSSAEAGRRVGSRGRERRFLSFHQAGDFNRVGRRRPHPW